MHLLVSVPPSLSVSKLVQRIEGVTSRKLLQENRGLNKAYWGRHLWSRGYFVASIGDVTDEVIARYIENQQAAVEAGFTHAVPLKIETFRFLPEVRGCAIQTNVVTTT